jgi:glycosyltransferase involved in cell wall biosynthesis
LLVVGSGELQPELMNQVSRDRIQDVTFTGFLNRSEISESFAAADAFILASRHDETWGIVVNEAMNFDMPILVTAKVGSAQDLVQHGRNGFIVSATDPTELAERLVELADSASRRQEMGTRSSELVRAWDHKVAADGALRAIEAAAGARRWGLANQS